MDKLKVFLHNSLRLHHRLMMRYLRKRGWVVFYLESEHRKCNGGTCWLSLYDVAIKIYIVDKGSLLSRLRGWWIGRRLRRYYD